MDFNKFKQAVAAQFAIMQQYPLFSTKVDKDALWAQYLAAFPAGTNPIFRVRTHHDCGCCKQFIRNIGGVVAIIDDKVVSIWDLIVQDEAYQTVANALASMVHAHKIEAPYFHYEKSVGTDRNFEQLLDSQKAWDHFFVNLPASTYLRKDMIASTIGDKRTTYEVAERGFREITDDAIETVIDLITGNSLYRGEEHLSAVKAFANLRARYKEADNKNVYVWKTCMSNSAGLLRLRNSVIGTLLVDLSDGVELEKAVASFESKVAPTNYKRPTALVTKAMIDNAKKEIEALGLTSSLSRRYAQLTDITVNNVLFANRDARATISNSVLDDLVPTAAEKVMSDPISITIDKFLTDVLPTATSIEALVENRHQNNMMSLLTAVDPTAPLLFKWNNPFSWSYTGEVADSIKERVKAAGGNVDGDLCCRLAWNNRDDLDFHMIEPSGYEIYFGNRRARSADGGMLDLDANGADGQRSDPAENIYYANKRTMKKGTYKLYVHQYSQREKSNVGFEVEIEALGVKYNMTYPNEVKRSERIVIAEIHYDGESFTIDSKLPATRTSKEAWGIKTEQFTPVSVVMQSPNHWDGQDVGNRHVFFMLQGCKNNSPARGFYNEFLRSELEPHRRVLELVGGKATVQEVPDQLNGIGFSSTQRNNLVCRVKGSFVRTYNITF